MDRAFEALQHTADYEDIESPAQFQLLIDPMWQPGYMGHSIYLPIDPNSVCPCLLAGHKCRPATVYAQQQ